MSGTIQDWEDRRFAAEAAAEIDAIETVEVERTSVADTDTEARPELIALAGRVTAGLGVQLLITAGAENRRAFVTIALAGATETFEVKPEDAMDAYLHPYCYGASLPL